MLAANQAAIAQCHPGALFNAPHEAAIATMVEGLIALGLLRVRPRTLSAARRICSFVRTKLAHWLGLDVHDVGDYRLAGEWRPLQPGMVLTVEPGIYIPVDVTGRDNQQVSNAAGFVIEAARGIGIRIEDDVLITESG